MVRDRTRDPRDSEVAADDDEEINSTLQSLVSTSTESRRLRRPRNENSHVAARRNIHRRVERRRGLILSPDALSPDVHRSQGVHPHETGRHVSDEDLCREGNECPALNLMERLPWSNVPQFLPYTNQAKTDLKYMEYCVKLCNVLTSTDHD